LFLCGEKRGSRESKPKERNKAMVGEMVEKCPYCRKKTAYGQYPSDFMRCGNCGRQYTAEMEDEENQRKATLSKGLLTKKP